MAENDAVNGRVTVHAGTHYGGAAQKVDDYRHSPGDDILVERARKFVDRKTVSVRTDEKSSETVSIENIHWVTKREKTEVMVNCSHLADIVKKLMTGRSLLFNPLYKILFFAMRDSHLPPVARFCVVAINVDPTNKKKMGTFIKARIGDEEFVLPNSFLRDCSAAFLKSSG